MRLPKFELASPGTVAEACGYLEGGRDEAQVIAGGTDLLVALKEGQKTPKMVVDLGGVEGLNGIDYAPDSGLEIGALVSLRRLAGDAAVGEHYPVLAHAALEVGSPQLRSMATVAGNLCQDSCCMYFNRPAEIRLPLPPCHKLGGSICHVVATSPKCWAPYAGDMAPALMAIGATVTVADRNGEKTMAVGDIFTEDGARPVVLEAGQIITKIHCPAPPPRSGAAYIKMRLRDTLDYAVAGVATSVRLEDGGETCAEAVVVLTGVGSCPIAVPDAAELAGGALTDAAVEKVAEAATRLSYPVKNVLGSEPGYRRSIVKLNVERSLRKAEQIAAVA
jgi:4-hydroxybenzoyl-CoA reductase subunit beta